MTVQLVCDCGNELAISGDKPGDVRCLHCGRLIVGNADKKDKHAHVSHYSETYSSIKSPAAENTETVVVQKAEEAPEEKPADDVGAAFWVNRQMQEPEMHTQIVVEDIKEIDFLAEGEKTDGETLLAVVIPESNHPNNQNAPNVPPSSHHPSSSGSRRGSSSKVEVDLSKRVMGTINRPTAPLSAEPDTGMFGIHRILRTHQRGGMGRILIAYDQYLKRDVALKELHPEVAEDELIVQRFIGEAEITAQLEHPGIIPIHSLSLDKDGYPYYTMKLIKGRTFQDAIKAYHREPSKQELMGLVRRLVSISKTMAFAHSKGVIHRDLKPANIMLGEHGETLVMDWGLAKPISQEEDLSYSAVAVDHKASPRMELTMIGAIVGTPAFMSPEQASPENYFVGPLADIFSLGTILYYLLAGQTAFAGRSTQEVLSKVRAANPTRPSQIKSNVPEDLEAICMKAMAKEADQRYQTATDFADDLCRWLDGEHVLANPEKIPKKVRRWIGKHIAVSLSIPLMIVLMAVSTFFGIRFNVTRTEKAKQALIAAIMSESVDLTDFEEIHFIGSPGVQVKREKRYAGGDMLIINVPKSSEHPDTSIEIEAPSVTNWDISKWRQLTFSLFEEQTKGTARLSKFSVRMGCGSSYYEFTPSKEFWENRKQSNWFPYSVSLVGSLEWERSRKGTPSLRRIEWIEFHFSAEEPMTFRVDKITFM